MIHGEKVTLEKFLKFHFSLKYTKMNTSKGGGEAARTTVLMSMCPFTSQKLSFFPRIAFLLPKISLLFSRRALLFPGIPLLFSRIAFFLFMVCIFFKECFSFLLIVPSHSAQSCLERQYLPRSYFVYLLFIEQFMIPS